MKQENKVSEELKDLQEKKKNNFEILAKALRDNLKRRKHATLAMQHNIEVRGNDCK